MYEDLIQQTALRYGVPPDLALAQARAESSLNPRAVSKEGAIGLMQLMPRTAAMLGVDPWDPVQNIDGGLRYLSQLYNQFGSWDMALAAYNAGPGNISKGIFPTETQNYVARIFNSIGQIPAAFMAALSPPGPTPGPTSPRRPGRKGPGESTA